MGMNDGFPPLKVRKREWFQYRPPLYRVCIHNDSDDWQAERVQSPKIYCIYVLRKGFRQACTK